jgi:hypothetical protein
MDRWPPLQANDPHFPVNLVKFFRPTTGVGRSKRPFKQPRLFGVVCCCEMILGSLISSVFFFFMLVTFFPFRDTSSSPLCGLHNHHSHVPQADAAYQLQPTRTVFEGMEFSHQRLEEHRDDIRECRIMISQNPTSQLFGDSVQCVEVSRYLG